MIKRMAGLWCEVGTWQAGRHKELIVQKWDLSSIEMGATGGESQLLKSERTGSG